MKSKVTSVVLTLTLLLGCAPTSSQYTPEVCTQTRLESVRLMCRADSIRAKRVQYSAGGAVIGAMLGGAVVAADGGDAGKGALAGAVAGSLVGYWLNQRNAIAQEHASVSARAQELDRRAAAAVALRRQRSRALTDEVDRAQSVRDLPTRKRALRTIVEADRLADADYSSEKVGLEVVAPRVGVPTSRTPKMPADLLAGVAAKKACNALIDLGDNCKYQTG